MVAAVAVSAAAAAVVVVAGGDEVAEEKGFVEEVEKKFRFVAVEEVDEVAGFED